VWSGPLAAGGLGILARRFSSDGAPLGDELVVEGPVSSLEHFTTSVATTSGFAFVAAWDSGHQVFARRFDADGAPLGPSFLVSTEPVPPNLDYLDNLGRVSSDDGGAFEVTWRRDDTIETAAHYASRYFVDGSLHWSVQMCIWASQWNQGMSVSSGGALVAVWSNEVSTALVGQHFRADGSPFSDALVLVSCPYPGQLLDPRVAHLGFDPEEWVLVWSSTASGAQWDVFGELSPSWLFGDSFESGDPSAWSTVAP
jgi:hypothetical protein